MTTKRALIKELALWMECTDVAAKKVSEFVHRTNNRKTFQKVKGVSIHYFWQTGSPLPNRASGRNLRTGEECKIRARTSVKFKASEILIQKLNPGK